MQDTGSCPTPVRASPQPRAPRAAAAGALLLYALAGLSACLAPACRPAEETHRVPPAGLNLLLITMDTTRADRLGCYGYAAARTPRLDALAQEGVRFSNCRTCVSLTLPSHSSLMTGNYPFVHGVRRNGAQRLADSNVTLAEAARDAGLHAEAIVASFVLNRMFGLDQGFAAYSDVLPGGGTIALHAERRGDEVAGEACARLSALAGGRFMLWVHFFDPHHPYLAADGTPVESFAAYDDEIAFMDTQIGRLLDALTALELERSTLVVLVGDHGESLGEHGEYQHGYFTYESTLHVPLLLRCPGHVPAGRTVDALVRTIDVAPTVLELLGLPAWSRVQGVSLVALCRGEAGDPELGAYAESFEAHDQFGLARLYSMAMGPWKYIHAPGAELYNLTADSGERINRVSDQPEVARELQALLRDTIQSAPPQAAEAPAVRLSGADRARLEALGYTGSTATADADGSELERLEIRGGDPKDAVAQMQAYGQAHWAMMAGDFAQAEQLLAPVVAAVPRAVRVRGDLAFVLHKQGKVEAAEDMYCAAIAESPNDAYLRRMYGGLLMRTQRWAEALDQLSVALAEQPDDLEVIYNMASALAAQGKLADARGRLEQALQLDPRHVSSLHAMGAYLARDGRWMEAEAYFRKALAIDPHHARARHDLQEVLRAQGRE